MILVVNRQLQLNGNSSFIFLKNKKHYIKKGIALDLRCQFNMQIFT